MSTKIPVQRPYLGAEELEAVRKVFESRWLGEGEFTRQFESRLQEYLGVRHVAAVNNGTSALHAALEACGIGASDEVIVPSLTYIATIQAILSVGARPVFCEVESDSLTMDPSDVASRLTSRSRAIIPVHFGGVVCPMDELMALARENDLRVIEDAAHALGSSYKGRMVGTLGHATCFSFDPIKNITCGEGGAVTTQDQEIANRVIRKRTLGVDKNAWDRNKDTRAWSYQVTDKGYRYHLPNLNAAIGLEQLKRIEAFKTRKLEILRQYDSSFAPIQRLRRLVHDHETIFPFFYVIRVLNGLRDPLMKYLEGQGIGTGVHYIPNHLQPLFADYRQSLPITEKLYEEIMTVPLYFEMTPQDVETVINAIRAFFEKESDA